jgi:hypothetical protein
MNLRALQRRRTAYETDGLLGLVDRRTVRATSVAGRTDPRVIEALQRVLERNKQRSSGTSDRLWRELVRELEAQHGPGEVPLPSRATFHRLLKRPAEARHAKRRQTRGSVRTGWRSRMKKRRAASSISSMMSTASSMSVPAAIGPWLARSRAW